MELIIENIEKNFDTCYDTFSLVEGQFRQMSIRKCSLDPMCLYV